MLVLLPVLLVSGVINNKVAPYVKHIYEQAPKPIFVVGVGTCPVSGCCFKQSHNVSRNGNMIPIDLFISGCPPKPEAMIEGVTKLMGVLNA